MNGIRQTILRRRPFPEDFGGGSLREYRPGEDARAIDWRASARRGSIQLRDRERAAELTWAAIVDGSGSMQAGRRRSLYRSAVEAAAFWRACAESSDRWADLDPAGSLDLAGSLEHALRILPANSALLAAGDCFELPSVPFGMLRAAAQRLDCTALIARDPWLYNLPLAGSVTVADLETRETRRFFIGSRERSNFARATRGRENAAIALFREAGWRAALFDEDTGAHALFQAFGTA